MALTKSDFEFISELVRARSGIVLEAGKEYLVEARLATVIRRHKLDSIAALAAQLRAYPADPLATQVVDAMTTHETSFFRDHYPFEALRKVVLPALMARRAVSKTLTIWCGACAMGQEPYTIAMTLCETIPKIEEWRITFIATDICADMITQSRNGKFTQLEVNRGLPAPLLIKYFEKHGMEWQIKRPLRSMIEFRELNLTQEWGNLPAMDIIFMRNVLIYFDTPTKQEIFRRVRGVLKPDGYLFLGCAETTMCVDDNFARAEIEKGSYYHLAQPVVAAA
ncbi:MAG: protein-glutamate O-methyltransferase CheR [Tepidisphaeraceae bacterium]